MGSSDGTEEKISKFRSACSDKLMETVEVVSNASERTKEYLEEFKKTGNDDSGSFTYDGGKLKGSKRAFKRAMRSHLNSNDEKRIEDFKTKEIDALKTSLSQKAMHLLDKHTEMRDDWLEKVGISTAKSRELYDTGLKALMTKNKEVLSAIGDNNEAVSKLNAAYQEALKGVHTEHAKVYGEQFKIVINGNKELSNFYIAIAERNASYKKIITAGQAFADLLMNSRMSVNRNLKSLYNTPVPYVHLLAHTNTDYFTKIIEQVRKPIEDFKQEAPNMFSFGSLSSGSSGTKSDSSPDASTTDKSGAAGSWPWYWILGIIIAVVLVVCAIGYFLMSSKQ